MFGEVRWNGYEDDFESYDDFVMHLGDWDEDEIVEDLVRTGDPDFEDDYIGEDHESEIDTEYIGDDFDDDDPETA